jgi:hypothetical protein
MVLVPKSKDFTREFSTTEKKVKRYFKGGAKKFPPHGCVEIKKEVLADVCK